MDLSINSRVPKDKSSEVVDLITKSISCISSEGGWIFFFGAPFDERKKIPLCLSTDVTPTILYLFGLPVAEDMHGRVLDPLMKDLWRRTGKRYISSYEINNFRVKQPFHETIYHTREEK